MSNRYADFGRKPVPAWNEEVTHGHAGEDGPCWWVDCHRQMFIQEQIDDSLLDDPNGWKTLLEDSNYDTDEEVYHD